MAAARAPEMPMGTPLFDVLRTGLDCVSRTGASGLHGGPPETIVRTARERVELCAGGAVLADDCSDLYGYLVGTLNALGRSDEAAAVAERWAAFLEGEAARAPTPAARSVFDAHRLTAYLALKQPARAVGMLEDSARDFPGDYNPHARLAAAYLAMKRYDDALGEADAALVRAYGPRKLRIWSTKADVLAAKGDRAGERAALRAALDFARATPLPGAYPKLRDALEKRLTEVR
jgi:tetratricopeptide (TPR) repeat protein